MAFAIIAIRTPEDNGDGRYPDVTSSDDSHLVSLEPADGAAITRVRAQRIAVYQETGGDLPPIIEPVDLELDVIITDARLIVASRKFDQCRTWGGLGPAGVVAAGALTVISKASAAQRRRGKTLAGHIRYPWVNAIAVNQRIDRHNGQEIIRLQLTDDTGSHGRRLILELVFPPLTPMIRVTPLM
ncbi:hypothetical protein [Jatrophihabitans sp.]|jgi:hypothetical protein|uniref:hypothetical protein n=1 Tax=Jatrophihabitans sp. TaxID=1932789 RepID=UPI002EE30FA9